jgi:hypothetical protein
LDITYKELCSAGRVPFGVWQLGASSCFPRQVRCQLSTCHYRTKRSRCQLVVVGSLRVGADKSQVVFSSGRGVPDNEVIDLYGILRRTRLKAVGRSVPG